MSDLTERLTRLLERNFKPIYLEDREALTEAITALSDAERMREELVIANKERDELRRKLANLQGVERWRKGWPKEAQHVFGRIIVVPHSDAEDALARVEAELARVMEIANTDVALWAKRANEQTDRAEGAEAERDEARTRLEAVRIVDNH